MTQQGNSVVPMGLCLENYTYPYPVTYITLKIQRQEFMEAVLSFL
jgi:hypothetical protein